MTLPRSKTATDPEVVPGKRRGGRASRFRRHRRFSFGPPLPRLALALDRFKELITTAS